MSAEPRTVTLQTADRCPVTVPEPAWCRGHSHHDPETVYAEVLHSGPDVTLTYRYAVLLTACLVQSPHATPTEGLGGPTPGVSVHPLGETLTPVGLYDLAAALDTYADQLRNMADQLTAILAGGDQ